MKMDLKVSSAKWRPFYLDLNVLTRIRPVVSSSPSGDETLMGKKYTAHIQIELDNF